MSQEIPLFDIGREWDAFLKDPPTRDSDFSSSGDEVMSQMELDLENITPCPSPCQQSTTSNSSSRFKVTTEAERERILEDADAANTKRNTKGAVKIFKSKSHRDIARGIPPPQHRRFFLTLLLL